MTTTSAANVVDIFIENMLQHRERGPRDMPLVNQKVVISLCQRVRNLFLDEPTRLAVDPGITICGDIHGQYFDLLRIFEIAGYPPSTRYLFLGDYVDRGKWSLETICLLFAFKCLYPNNIFLLRGNHEDEDQNRTYGFFDECKRKYTRDGVKVYKSFLDVFKTLPLCAVVGKRIFCCHGGLSQYLNKLSDIDSIERFTAIPEQGLFCDLLWSDPAEEYIEGFKENEDRGVSVIFGPDVVKKFVKRNDLDLCVHAHRVVQDGYEFFAKKKMVTIFSAPNYHSEFDNSGAVLVVSPELYCNIKILQPEDQKKKAPRKKS